MAILPVSGGQGFWLLVASVQRFCEEGGRWVTFLYEKVDVMDGVSDVDNHEQVQPDKRIECFSEGV
jgi:hypothetical protein